MLEASIEQVIRCERRDCFVVRVEVWDGRPCHVPSISASESNDRQSGPGNPPGDAGIVEISNDAIAFPRAQVRQSLVFQCVFFNEDAVMMTLLQVRSDARHHLEIICRPCIVDECDPAR